MCTLYFYYLFPFHIRASQRSFISIIFFPYFISLIPFLITQEFSILFHIVWNIQDLILTCLQEPKEVEQRPWLLGKSPVFSTVFSCFVLAIILAIKESVPSMLSESGAWKYWSVHFWRWPHYASASVLPFGLGIFHWQPGSYMGREGGTGITSKAASLSDLSFEKSILALVFRHFVCNACSQKDFSCCCSVKVKCRDLGVALGERKSGYSTVFSTQDLGHLLECRHKYSRQCSWARKMTELGDLCQPHSHTQVFLCLCIKLSQVSEEFRFLRIIYLQTISQAFETIWVYLEIQK